mmetsp:Transcript_96115/g.152032  ORF Transcript_96115/g.152032 Transcript_96115/m.152032 type:complete len:87 (+) Transcript_96115:370-630(+)
MLRLRRTAKKYRTPAVCANVAAEVSGMPDEAIGRANNFASHGASSSSSAESEKTDPRKSKSKQAVTYDMRAHSTCCKSNQKLRREP